MSNTASTVAITIIRDRKSRGMTEVPGIEGATLADALTREWPCDAHFTAYEPMALPVADTDRTAVVRLLHERDPKTDRPSYYEVRDDLELPPVRMQALVGDVDGPGHTATAEWRTETEAKLNTSGLMWYATRNGYRVLMPLPTPFQISEPAHAESWKTLYLGWCEYVEQTHGIALDRKCKDWTRLMRLPNVQREGRAERSAVHTLKAPRVFNESMWLEPAGTAAAPRTTEREGVDREDMAYRRAVRVAEHMPPAISGARGDEALFQCAREIATCLGEDANAIEQVLTDVYNPRCIPPWDATKLKREAERAAKAQGAPEARYLRRKEERRAENDNGGNFYTPDDSPYVDPDSMPILLISAKGESIFVREGEDATTYRECGMRALKVVMRECGWTELLSWTDDRGKYHPVKEGSLLEKHSTSCVAVETDFARPGKVTWDPQTRKVLLGVAPKVIEPHFDEGVDAWLRAMAGAKYGALTEWIAGTHQRHIHRPATALSVFGDHGLGKTMISIVCARMWCAETPVELGHVVAKFNASMSKCPIVLDDECKTLSKRIVSTEDFRTILQERVRSYEPKGQEMRTLHGAQRFVLTANDVSALTFANAMGDGAVEAIAERLLLIDVPKDSTQAVKDRLDDLRREDGELDLPRFESHFRWIQENTEVPNAKQRFIGADPDKAGARQAALVSTIDGAPELFERLRADMLGETVAVGPEAVCFCAAGRLWVRTEAIGGVIGHGYDGARVRKALGAFRDPTRGFVRRDGKTVRGWCLDIQKLGVALGMTPNEIEEAQSREAPAAAQNVKAVRNFSVAR